MIDDAVSGYFEAFPEEKDRLEKIKLVESGKTKGKTYTPDEYLRHIDQVLKN